MKVAIKKEPGHVPGGGFHYMTHPEALADGQVAIWKVMGYHVIELPDERGAQFIAEARAALKHQVEASMLVDGPAQDGVVKL